MDPLRQQQASTTTTKAGSSDAGASVKAEVRLILLSAIPSSEPLDFESVVRKCASAVLRSIGCIAHVGEREEQYAMISMDSMLTLNFSMSSRASNVCCSHAQNHTMDRLIRLLSYLHSLRRKFSNSSFCLFVSIWLHEDKFFEGIRSVSCSFSSKSPFSRPLHGQDTARTSQVDPIQALLGDTLFDRWKCMLISTKSCIIAIGALTLHLVPFRCRSPNLSSILSGLHCPHHQSHHSPRNRRGVCLHILRLL